MTRLRPFPMPGPAARGHAPRGARAAAAGFTLIELIGVLAILAILAGVVAPNALRSLDRAAIRAEITTLEALGAQVKLYLRDHATLPTAAVPPANPNWTTELAAYADLAPPDLLTNRRHNDRVFLVDPAAPGGRRAMILSSMRSGLNLPPAASINTAAEFDAIWQTPDGAVPPASSWSGWNAWNGVADAGQYLVIARINLAPVYATDLQVFTVTLNNLSAAGGGPGATASYNVVTGSGSAGATINLAPGATVILTNLHSRDRVNLYQGAGGAGLVYSFVLSGSGKTFDFNGAQWIPQ